MAQKGGDQCERKEILERNSKCDSFKTSKPFFLSLCLLRKSCWLLQKN